MELQIRREKIDCYSKCYVFLINDEIIIDTNEKIFSFRYGIQDPNCFQNIGNIGIEYHYYNPILYKKRENAEKKLLDELNKIVSESESIEIISSCNLSTIINEKLRKLIFSFHS